MLLLRNISYRINLLCRNVIFEDLPTKKVQGMSNWNLNPHRTVIWHLDRFELIIFSVNSQKKWLVVTFNILKVVIGKPCEFFDNSQTRNETVTRLHSPWSRPPSGPSLVSYTSAMVSSWALSWLSLEIVSSSSLINLPYCCQFNFSQCLHVWETYT